MSTSPCPPHQLEPVVTTDASSRLVGASLSIACRHCGRTLFQLMEPKPVIELREYTIR